MSPPNGPEQPRNQTAEERINDAKFGKKMGFEQKTTYHAYHASMNTKSGHYHNQYSFAKNTRLAKERHKRYLAEKVRKACNPDQLSKFVTTFKLSSITDQKRTVATSQADTHESFVAPRDDVHRPENPDKWLANDTFRTESRRKDNFDLRIAATKSLGNMMGLLRDPEMPPKRIKRRSWVNRVPDQCNKWENFLARVKVAADQAGSTGSYEASTEFRHRPPSPEGRTFRTKFKKTMKGVPMSGTQIPLLSATEAEINRRPKFDMFPFGWYNDGGSPAQHNGVNELARTEGVLPGDTRPSLRRRTGEAPSTTTRNDRENMMSRASMTSNVTLFSRDLLDTRGSTYEMQGAESFGTPWTALKVMTPGTGRSSMRDGMKPLQQLGNTV
jgi:hypothetical protein